ncbi:OpgC family protein [Roseomonas sp. HF4]|uniref:OpgC family protein n=1 Tax=Roseomonas sp. HF4 TaxID=2562313 RepID=UPI0010BFFB5C|nr:OpgC domain-containing protein [Roseomonas sp. HF4]
MMQFVRLDRDLRVDFFRGLALWAIFVNHMPGNWLGNVTTRNYTLSDASEGFVFLAGFAAALAFGMVLDRQGWFFAASRVMGRVFTLYVAHIFLFVVFTAQVGFSAATLDSAVYLDEMHLDPFAQEPYRAMLEALLLRYQPSFLDILPLYIVLLTMFAIAMPLLRRMRLLLGLSLGAWLAVRLLDWNLPAWPDREWMFNPLAWQALFFAGCALGYRPPGAEPFVVPFRRWLAALCAVLLLATAVAVLLATFRPDYVNDRFPAWAGAFLAGIDKNGLHPMRFASMLAIAYLVAYGIPRGARWLASRPAAPLVLLGQQSLPVFCAGIFLSFLGRVAIEFSDHWPMQAAVNLAGLGAMVAVGLVTAWYGAEKRGTRRPASAAPQGSTT